MDKLLSDVNLWMRRLYDYKLIPGYEVLQVEMTHMGTLFEVQLKMKGPSPVGRFTTGHRRASPEEALQASFESLRKEYGAPDSEQRIDVSSLKIQSQKGNEEIFILGTMDFWVSEFLQASAENCSCNVKARVFVSGDGTLGFSLENIYHCNKHKSAKAIEELMAKIYNHPLDGKNCIVELQFSKLVVLEGFFVGGEIVDKHAKVNKKGAIGATGKTLLEALGNLLESIEDEYKDVEFYLIGVWDEACESYIFVQDLYGTESGPRWTRDRKEAQRFAVYPPAETLKYVKAHKPAISGLDVVHPMPEKCECICCRMGEGKCHT